MPPEQRYRVGTRSSLGVACPAVGVLMPRKQTRALTAVRLRHRPSMAGRGNAEETRARVPFLHQGRSHCRNREEGRRLLHWHVCQNWPNRRIASQLGRVGTIISSRARKTCHYLLPAAQLRCLVQAPGLNGCLDLTDLWCDWGLHHRPLHKKVVIICGAINIQQANAPAVSQLQRVLFRC